MLDELRDRITYYLTQNQVCIVSTSGTLGAWAIPARYESRGLEIDCLLPAWSDPIYHLEQDPHALVIVLDTQSGPCHWLQYRGIARLDPCPAGDRYVAVHVTPERLDLIDERRGWGARETLELC